VHGQSCSEILEHVEGAETEYVGGKGKHERFAAGLSAYAEESEMVRWWAGKRHVVSAFERAHDAVCTAAQSILPDMVAEFAGEAQEGRGSGVESGAGDVSVG
jgi:hypothetical protein